jgi:hypothetical protein
MSSTDAAGRPSSDPERSSSRRLGNGLIIRAQRFDSSRVLQYTTFARLAQLAERRSLKSEARGSSPRSCTNSLDLRRLCEADPLSMVARSTFRQHELLAVSDRPSTEAQILKRHPKARATLHYQIRNSMPSLMSLPI